MRFRLNKLLGAPVGTRQYERLDRGHTWLDDELQVSFLRGDLTFMRTNENILVEGTIESATFVQCVRSLEMFELPITFALDDISFTLPGFTPPEPDRRIRDDGYIDLSETLRELIIMSIPINPIAPHHENTESLVGLSDPDDSEWLTVKWTGQDDIGRGALS